MCYISDGWLCILILLILISVFIIFLYEPAYAMKMDLMSWTIDKNPIFCIGDLKHYKWSTIKAINEWNNFTKEGQWKMWYSADNSKCNVYILEMINLQVNGEDGQGFGICNDSGCNIFLRINDNSQEDRVRTVAHEIGHIISLGHFPDPEGVEETLALGACQEAVMWWVGGCGYPVFHKDLLTALECRHGGDGFGGVVNHKCLTLKWDLV